MCNGHKCMPAKSILWRLAFRENFPLYNKWENVGFIGIHYVYRGYTHAQTALGGRDKWLLVWDTSMTKTILAWF
jgi:hypothetical protein